MKSFQHKIVVITGAGSGIGRALAIAFAKLGAKLALNDFKQAGLAETTALLHSQCQLTDNRLLSSTFDVADKTAMQQFADTIKNQWGNAHVIINNAGISGLGGPAYLLPEQEYRQVMNINFFGVLNGCQAFLPQLVANNEGAVVNISSIFGLIGAANASAYCASKFAVRGYTETLAIEFYKSPISIHCVHPGGINTNIAENEENKEFARKYLTTPPADLAQQIIKGIKNKKVKIVYGRDSFKAWVGSNLVPQSWLNFFIWQELKKILDLNKYRTFIKNL